MRARVSVVAAVIAICAVGAYVAWLVATPSTSECAFEVAEPLRFERGELDAAARARVVHGFEIVADIADLAGLPELDRRLAMLPKEPTWTDGLVGTDVAERRIEGARLLVVADIHFTYQPARLAQLLVDRLRPPGTLVLEALPVDSLSPMESGPVLEESLKADWGWPVKALATLIEAARDRGWRIRPAGPRLPRPHGTPSTTPDLKRWPGLASSGSESRRPSESEFRRHWDRLEAELDAGVHEAVTAGRPRIVVLCGLAHAIGLVERYRTAHGKRDETAVTLVPWYSELQRATLSQKGKHDRWFIGNGFLVLSPRALSGLMRPEPRLGERDP